MGTQMARHLRAEAALPMRVLLHKWPPTHIARPALSARGTGADMARGSNTEF